MWGREEPLPFLIDTLIFPSPPHSPVIRLQESSSLSHLFASFRCPSKVILFSKECPCTFWSALFFAFSLDYRPSALSSLPLCLSRQSVNLSGSTPKSDYFEHALFVVKRASVHALERKRDPHPVCLPFSRNRPQKKGREEREEGGAP